MLSRLHQTRVTRRFALGLCALVLGCALPTAAFAAGSLSFNGTNSRARFTALPALTVFTVEVWVKRTVDTGRYETFVSNADSAYMKETFGLYVDGGNADCGSSPADQFAWAFTKSTGGWVTQCSGVSANLNAWHHMAVVRDAVGAMNIFIDGALKSTIANAGLPNTSTAVLTVGEAADALVEYFPGLLDELRISSSARYTTGFTPSRVNFSPDASTVALYHFDEGIGQTLADASGNGRNGVLGTSTSAEGADPQWSTDTPVSATVDTTAPVITSVTSSGVTASAATITWTTDEPATSQVQYGPTTTYGSTSVLDGNLVLAHAVTLTGLNAAATYNFRVLSKDATGNQGVSGNATFTTTAASSTPPVITVLAPSSITQSSAVVNWTTDVLADGQVEYGTSTAYGSLTPLNTTVATSHSESVSGLSSGQTYHYRVRSRGQNGQLATSGDGTFATSPSSAATQGQWSQAMNWPLVAVHASLLSSGNVLLWDAWETPGTPSGKVWNPSTQAFTNVPVPNSALFCAGQTYLSDGRPYVIGGHHGGDYGIADVNVFDTATNAWVPLAPMNYSRWYPTAVALNDGRLLALGGEITPGVFADVPEVYDPATNAWTLLPAATLYLDEYPAAFVAPDGKVFVVAGPDLRSRTLDVASQAWTTMGTAPVPTGTSAMYRPGRIIATGGGTGNTDPVQKGTAVIDLNQATPGWRQTAQLAYPRVQHNLVLLPDGKVLAVGGSTKVSLTSTVGILPAELWDPAGETWTTMASMRDLRMYHSIAMLLLDGRVLVAGGGRLSPVPDYLTAEIYSPPYLFKGARPTIASAPGSVTLASTFSVQTPDAASIASVSLIRMPSVTHTYEMSARFIPLTFTPRTGALDVQAPANVNIAQPGPYMLFIVNATGVPSVASVVKVAGASSGDSQPPAVSITMPAPNATVSGAISVGANASDASGVSSVEFLVDGAPVATPVLSPPYTASWNTAATSNGLHALTARAIDGAGNTGTAQINVTVSNASAAPTVSAQATPTSVTQGGTSVLSWTSANALSLSIDQGIGTVPFSGTLSVSPSATTLYTVTASNGSTTATATALLTVTPPLPLPTASLIASPTMINQGAATTLSWSTTNATTASINNGVGAVGTTGAVSVTPSVTTTYTITATNSTGTATATTTVTVIVPPPTISFSATPATVAPGGSATLSWTTNATSVSIDQGVGAVAATGSKVVTPAATAIYTLTASGPGGTSTATTTVTVSTTITGYSLSYNGSTSRARFTVMPALAAFTVEAWVKRTADTGRYETFISNADGGYGKETFGLYVDGGNVDCGASPPDQFAWAFTRTTSGWFTQCSGVSANLNAWHHIAVTLDATNTARIFIDGIPRGSAASGGAATASTGALTVGEAADALTEFYPGLVDEVRVSSVVRYTATFTPPAANLATDASTLGLYHFDEGTGQVVSDASGNGRNGTLGTTTAVESVDPQWSSDAPIR